MDYINQFRNNNLRSLRAAQSAGVTEAPLQKSDEEEEEEFDAFGDHAQPTKRTNIPAYAANLAKVKRESGSVSNAELAPLFVGRGRGMSQAGSLKPPSSIGRGRSLHLGSIEATTLKTASTASVRGVGRGVRKMKPPVVSNENVAAVADYAKFAFDRHPIDVSNLPIVPLRETILSAVNNNPVTIIQGSTGCGKSTQLPQFILDDCYQKKTRCDIIITQPRRIAATSLAERVSTERDWKSGSLVGFQVGLRRHFTEETRVLYVTVGVLLEKLIAQRKLDSWTHVILDEVHERSQEMDMCLLLVKQCILEQRPTTRVILMSASAETGRLAEYFATYEPFYPALEPSAQFEPLAPEDIVTRKNKPPVITVDGRLFDVEVFYLEDIAEVFKKEQINFEFRQDIDDEDDDRTNTEVKRGILKELLHYFDKLDRKAANCSEENSNYQRGSVLVFLPGLSHITDVRDYLIGYRPDDTIIEGCEDQRHRWSILPLHSTITRPEQQRVFSPVSTGYRKIILSTNIAESSITVPDIRYVVDFCLTKRLRRDTSNSHFSTLKLEYTSKSSCSQRKGRAGRLADGLCFRLVTKNTYETFSEFCPAEIQIAPLEHVILRVKLLDRDPITMLNDCLDKPNVEDVGLAILTLKEVGALTVMRKRTSGDENEEYDQRRETYGGCMVRDLDHMDGDLTYVGKIISRLPVDVHIGKLIALGYAFGVLKDAIIIGAGMAGSRSIFKQPFQGEKPEKSLDAFAQRLSFALSSCSDCFCIRNAYRRYASFKQSGDFRGRLVDAERYCSSWYLDRLALNEMSDLITEIEERLKDVGIRVPMENLPNLPKQDPNLKDFMLQVAIAGAFYPNFFVRKYDSSIEAIATKVFGDKDPMYCVELGQLPMNKGLLYKNQLETMFKRYCLSRTQSDCKVVVDFHDTKGIVDFSDIKRHEEIFANSRDTAFNRAVSRPVLLALKMKQIPRLRPYVVKVKEDANVQKALEDIQKQSLMKYQITKGTLSTQRLYYENHVGYPGLEVNQIKLKVTYVQNCCHFFGIFFENEQNLYQMEEMISTYVTNNKMAPLTEVTPNTVCLARRRWPKYAKERYNDLAFTRARVKHESKSGAGKWLVYYLDYGGTDCVSASEMSPIPAELITRDYPFLALECVVAEVQPHSVFRPNGEYLPADKVAFEMKLFALKYVDLTIYSLVSNCLRVHLAHSLEFLSSDTIEVKEEDFASQSDHLERLKALRMRQATTTGNRTNQAMDHDVDILQMHQNEKYLEEEENLLKKLSDCVINSGTIPRSKINIQGPNHPYALSFYGMTSHSCEKKVGIAMESVNSVLVDDQPQCHLERAIVAGLVQSSSRDHGNLILRHTTLLPNLPGLPGLLALIFAPVAELRVNKGHTRYTGALCGLGYDESGHPLHPNNDMEITFDVQVDSRTLLSVNEIRLALNMILTEREWEDKMLGYHESVIHELQARIVTAVKKLFLDKTNPMHLVTPIECQQPYCWRLLAPSSFIDNSLRVQKEVGPHVLYQCHFSVCGVDNAGITNYLRAQKLIAEEPDKQMVREFRPRWRAEMTQLLDEVHMSLRRLIGPLSRQLTSNDELEKPFICELCPSVLFNSKKNEVSAHVTYGCVCTKALATIEHLFSEYHLQAEEAIRYKKNPLAMQLHTLCG